MAIDPDLYQKVTGRSGDASQALGEVLAGSDRQHASNRAHKEAPSTMGLGRAGLLLHPSRAIRYIAVLVLIVGLFALVAKLAK